MTKTTYGIPLLSDGSFASINTLLTAKEGWISRTHDGFSPSHTNAVLKADYVGLTIDSPGGSYIGHGNEHTVNVGGNFTTKVPNLNTSLRGEVEYIYESAGVFSSIIPSGFRTITLGASTDEYLRENVKVTTGSGTTLTLSVETSLSTGVIVFQNTAVSFTLQTKNTTTITASITIPVGFTTIFLNNNTLNLVT